MSWFVYILFCDQKTYYVGMSHDISQRLRSHKAKLNMATKEFSDIRLVYSEKFETRSVAESREKQLKGWSVAKKKALISDNLDLLVQLSKNHERAEEPEE